MLTGPSRCSIAQKVSPRLNSSSSSSTTSGSPAYGNTLQDVTTLPNYFVSKKEAVSGIYDAATCLKETQQMKGSHLGVTPVLKNKDQACFGDIGTLGIFTTTKNTAAAAKWVQFMMQPENQTFYNNHQWLYAASYLRA